MSFLSITSLGGFYRGLFVLPPALKLGLGAVRALQVLEHTLEVVAEPAGVKKTSTISFVMLTEGTSLLTRDTNPHPRVRTGMLFSLSVGAYVQQTRTDISYPKWGSWETTTL